VLFEVGGCSATSQTVRRCGDGGTLSACHRHEETVATGTKTRRDSRGQMCVHEPTVTPTVVFSALFEGGSIAAKVGETDKPAPR
jgi:hypothetical protein